MKLVTTAQMQALERAAAERGHGEQQMMEEAGIGIAQEVMITLGSIEGRKVLFLCGPGNNGGDGMVAARHLETWNAEVFVYLVEPRDEDDWAYKTLRDAKGHAMPASEDEGFELLEGMLHAATGVVDALLGTGLNRPIDGVLAEVMKRLAEARSTKQGPKLIAVDVPTGVDPDTGSVDPLTVAADATVALGFPKVGLYQLPGRSFAGAVGRVDIGIDSALAEDLPIDDISMRPLQPHMPKRPIGAHKGTFGRVTIVAGSLRYPGAARLASEAAVRGGAGLVALAAPQEAQPMVAAGLAEVIHEPLPSMGGAIAADAAGPLLRALGGTDAVLIGPGLTDSPGTSEFVGRVLAGLDTVEGLRAVVLDADALNSVADIEGWWERTTVPRVLTPHPGEMARLLKTTSNAIQADRLGSALGYAELTNSIVVLKGACTVIAAPDGRARLSDYASAVLATGGTGDVLAGLLVSLIGQGMDLFEAATAAVYLHSECAQSLESSPGPATAIASDLFRHLGEARRALDGR